MKVLKKTRCIFSMLLVVSVLFSGTPVVHGFHIILDEGGGRELKVLMSGIFQPEWKIAYRYGVDCKPIDRQNDEELKKAISASLRVWLKPLEELQLKRPIVDEFIYELQPDFDPDQPDDLEALRRVNLRVTFECTRGGRPIAEALDGPLFPPEVFMRFGTQITPPWRALLLHEIGHTFGLIDTYDMPGKPSTGGLRDTQGTQPASIMSVIYGFSGKLGEDDKRALIWFYRFFYEKQAINDCFFADYVLKIQGHHTCVPKHPLIFEVKHNPTRFALQILNDDPNLDVNAQDDSGLTALHHAVIREAYEVVDHLLSERHIKPFLRDKQGRNALAIARQAKLKDIITLLLEHPLTLPVHPKDKLATTWGAIKQR